VNVVNIVHYRDPWEHALRQGYEPLFSNSGLGPATETLARAELGARGADTRANPSPARTKSSSEFAVDLKFGITIGLVISEAPGLS
jgi:hypothetical protein